MSSILAAIVSIVGLILGALFGINKIKKDAQRSTAEEIARRAREDQAELLKQIEKTTKEIENAKIAYRNSRDEYRDSTR